MPVDSAVSTPEQAPAHAFAITRPDFMTALLRGLRRRCPSCGEGLAFRAYLKPVHACNKCGAALGEIRADDMPPYFTIFLVAHIVVPAILLTEQYMEPPEWLQMIVWPAVTLLMTLALLPYIKGGVLGVMWSLKMKGDEQH